jgi:hypothetical protein
MFRAANHNGKYYAEHVRMAIYLLKGLGEGTDRFVEMFIRK